MNRCKACGRETVRGEMTPSGRMSPSWCTGCDKMPGYCRCEGLESPEERIADHSHAWHSTGVKRDVQDGIGAYVTHLAVYCAGCDSAHWIMIEGSR